MLCISLLYVGLLQLPLLRGFGTGDGIKLFMESKHQNAAFLSDENMFNDLAFLTDITQHLTEMNLKLQGICHLVNKLFEHICAFEKN